MAVPLYESQARAPQAPGFELGTRPQIVTSSGEQTGAALGKFGEVLSAIGVKMKEAREATEVATATTDYLVKAHDAEKKAVENKDYAGAPGEFRATQDELITEATGRISDPVKREQLRARLTSHSLSALSKVERAAHGREADANLVSVNTSALDAHRNYIAAQSDAERGAARRGHQHSVDNAVAAGWLSRQAGQNYMNNFNADLDLADYTRIKRLDPQAAAAALAVPSNFPHIVGKQREALKTDASNAADQVLQLRAVATARTDVDTAREIAATIEQPAHRYQAMHSIDVVVQQQGAEETRQARAAAAILRSGDDQIDVMKHQFQHDPAALEVSRAANQRAAATGDPAAIKWMQDYATQTALQPIVQAAYQQPIEALEAQIFNIETAMRGPEAKTTPADVSLLKALKAVREEIHKTRDSEPIKLATVYAPHTQRQLGALPADPTEGAFGQELTRRQPMIEGQTLRVGGSQNVLLESEKNRLAEQWKDGTALERLAIARAVGGSLDGTTRTDTMAAITSNDPVAIMAAEEAGKNPRLAELLLQGQALASSPNVPKNKPETVQTVLQDKMGAQVFTSTKEQERAIAGAKAVYASLMNSGAALYETPDPAKLEAALQMVTGEIVRLNGVKVPTGAIGRDPGGRERFVNGWGAIDETHLALLGGAKDKLGNPIPAETIRNYAKLRPLTVGSTFYAVGMEDPQATDKWAHVERADGGPLVVDMTNVINRPPAPRYRPATNAELSTGRIRRTGNINPQSVDPRPYGGQSFDPEQKY